MYPLPIAANYPCECLDKKGLPKPGIVLEQYMTVGEARTEQFAEEHLLPNYDIGYAINDLFPLFFCLLKLQLVFAPVVLVYISLSIVLRLSLMTSSLFALSVFDTYAVSHENNNWSVCGLE